MNLPTVPSPLRAWSIRPGAADTKLSVWRTILGTTLAKKPAITNTTTANDMAVATERLPRAGPGNRPASQCTGALSASAKKERRKDKDQGMPRLA